MYIFGGNTPYGLQNDMWKFNFKLLQWSQVSNNNAIEACYRFGYTSYQKDNSTFFAVFGGKLADRISDDLWIYSLEKKHWTKMEPNGDKPPGLIFPCLEYYEGAIYLVCGEDSDAGDYDKIYQNETYVYNLTTSTWTKLDLTKNYDHRTYADTSLVGDYLYILFGYHYYFGVDVTNIQRLNLVNPTHWETFMEFDVYPPVRDSSSACTDGKDVYLGLGYNAAVASILNDLTKFSISSKSITTVTPNYLTPSNRMLHSMEVINGEFYLFGGFLGDSITDELWKFDPDTEVWEAMMPQGTTPFARYMHGSDSQGDIMVIWGGIGDSGLLGDMHYYNIQTKSWVEVIADGTVPTPRRGACLEMILPYVLIYGGETNEGLTNEVWLYNTGTNTYELVYKNEPNEPLIMLSICEAELVNDHIILYTMTGAGVAEAPYLLLKYFNLTDRQWTYIYDGSEDFDKTKTAPVAKKIGNTFLIIGGETWSTDAWNNVILAQPADLGDSDGIEVNPELNYTFYVEDKDIIDEYIYASAFVYFKEFIYSHGGGGQLGGSTRTTIPHGKLFKINTTKFCESFDNNCTATCSPGTYKNNETNSCEICSKGYYSEGYNNSECEPCPKGTFNSYDGANSIRQCYPCAEGTYINLPGASYCLECPPGYSCPSGSQSPSLNDLEAVVVSEQPKPYAKNSSKAAASENILYFTYSAIFFICLLLMILFRKKVFPIIVKLDLYTDAHNYDENVPLKLKKTFIGGIFTLCFLSLAILFIIYSIIEFSFNNIQETKTLVPLVIMEDEVSVFNSSLYLNLVFLRYGGDCVDENKQCVNSINLESFEIDGVFEQQSCKLSQELDCSIVYTCYKCTINKGAYINIVASEKTSYSSAISLNITADSSIEDTKSSLYILIKTPQGLIFKGSDPTIIAISATPSIYRKGITGTDHTGYHLSVNSQPELGSYYSTHEIAFTANLKVRIRFDLTDSSLYTLRYQSESEIILINGILGSVFGLMSFIMVIMKTTELVIIRLREAMKKRQARNNIAEKRKELEDQVCRNYNEDMVRNENDRLLSLKSNGFKND